MAGKRTKISLAILAVIFTIAFAFATLELPRIVNGILMSYFPDLGSSTVDPQIVSMMSYAVPIGYICLGIIIALVVLGLTFGKSRLSSLGALAFFLPTFGYFALSMFLLTGIGLTRIIWLPFWNTYFVSFLKLGDIAYVPYMAVVYPFYLLSVDVRAWLAYFAVGGGLLVFVIGTFAWLTGKLEQKKLVNFWIYKYSRHPQYLGYLVWSYGVMLLATLAKFPKGGYNPGPSLPWIVSSLIIICVALAEEIRMQKEYGKEYTKYQSATPFLLPLPKFISNIAVAPARLMFHKKSLPETKKEIFFTLLVYAFILFLASVPFLLLNWPPDYGWRIWPY